ncbi:hypothetical protein [Ferroplasma acidiphilum]|uniref:hypothetical protein n=1 Tax=Ferroplasma acidiphilum TaxID=74969 RepID=UPI00281662AF|nr:hypothetical protein [Ferroplasma acidiphilum]WMT53515.1 MAG: hypothetical protein RE473_01380 [Ferroplasma acidiphilum]
MVLNLVDLKEKLKPQLKNLWGIDDFKITKASHINKYWILGIEYQKPNKSFGGDTIFYSTERSVISANDETGEIDTIT